MHSQFYFHHIPNTYAISQLSHSIALFMLGESCSNISGSCLCMRVSQIVRLTGAVWSWAWRGSSLPSWSMIQPSLMVKIFGQRPKELCRVSGSLLGTEWGVWTSGSGPSILTGARWGGLGIWSGSLLDACGGIPVTPNWEKTLGETRDTGRIIYMPSVVELEEVAIEKTLSQPDTTVTWPQISGTK